MKSHLAIAPAPALAAPEQAELTELPPLSGPSEAPLPLPDPGAPEEGMTAVVTPEEAVEPAISNARPLRGGGGHAAEAAEAATSSSAPALPSAAQESPPVVSSSYWQTRTQRRSRSRR